MPLHIHDNKIYSQSEWESSAPGNFPTWFIWMFWGTSALYSYWVWYNMGFWETPNIYGKMVFMIPIVASSWAWGGIILNGVIFTYVTFWACTWAGCHWLGMSCEYPMPTPDPVWFWNILHGWGPFLG